MKKANVFCYVFEDGLVVYIINFVDFKYGLNDLSKLMKDHGKIVNVFSDYDKEVIIDEI